MSNQYEAEARERWGAIAAYREHEQKTKNYTKEKWTAANDGLMAIFAEFAACKNSGASADSAEAAEEAKLQPRSLSSSVIPTSRNSAVLSIGNMRLLNKMSCGKEY